MGRVSDCYSHGPGLIPTNTNGFFLSVFLAPGGPKGKERARRLSVVTKRLGACLGFDSRDRSLTGKNTDVAPDIGRANHDSIAVRPMLIPGEARLAPALRIEPEPVDNGL